MGWLQVKRWLSFLPAAFVVYILLHYLVYQPDLTGPQPPDLVAVSRVSNGSIVSDTFNPMSAPGARIIPPVPQDGVNNVPTENPSVAAPNTSPAEANIAVLEDSNTTQQHAGSGTTTNVDSDRPNRFDSPPKALGGIPVREPLSAQPLRDEVTFLSDGGLIGSGDLDTAPKSNSQLDISNSLPIMYSQSVLQEPSSISSLSEFGSASAGRELSDIVLVEPLDDVPMMESVVSSPSSSPSSLSSPLESQPSQSSSPYSSFSDKGNLLKSPHNGLISLASESSFNSNASEVDTPKGLAYKHARVQSMPSHPDIPKYSPPLTDYDETMNDVLQQQQLLHQQKQGEPLIYDQQNLRYPYQLYSDGHDSKVYSGYQQYKEMEEAMQQAILHHQSRIDPGNRQHPQALVHVPPISPDHDPSQIYLNGQEPHSSQERNAHQAAYIAGAPSYSSVKFSSTVQTSSSVSSGKAADTAGKEPPAPAVVPVDATGPHPPPQTQSLPPQAEALIKAVKNKPLPPDVIVVRDPAPAPQPVVQPKQTVTKKTTVVKKSNAASSSGLSINALGRGNKVGEKYESGFSVPHEELCLNNGRDLKVLVLITTAPDHEKHRTAVRQTWGHFAIRKDVVMAFVVGRTSNPAIQTNIDRENEIYGDIIQANFIDHYANLTLKTVSMFEWVKTYCSESHFVLKTDDDMFINMPLLLNFIDSKKSDRRVMYGRLAKGWRPVRNKKSKYYIDVATYKKTKYPDFLTGPAYLFTSDVVDDIYQKALGTTFFVLEDVLVTGIVGESLRIRRVGDSRFRNEKIKLTDTCALLKTVSIHMVKYEEQFDIYKRTLDGKAKCKTG